MSYTALLNGPTFGVSGLDLGIVVVYIAISLVVGLYFARRATTSVDHYFVGNRTLPWWLAGTSMIASAFSIDTPLGITGWVAEHGISGVWFAWVFVIGGAGTLGALVFAALIRRSNVITTAELAELRYGGPAAAALRAFKGVYFGVIAITISMGWVIHTVVLVSKEALGWDVVPTLAVIMAITIVYTTTSGFLGVVATDFVQFLFGVAGTVLLAYFAVEHVGGLDGLAQRLGERYGEADAARRLQFLPRPEDGYFSTFLVFITLKWWGNPPAAISQRMASTKNERHAMHATLLFAVVQFALNYWPMILTALVSLAVYPALPLEKAEQGYVLLLVKVLPTGVLGLTLASMVAAFMSTVDTQANTAASFMINDIYRRFLSRGRSERHYVRASQVSTVIIVCLGTAAAFYMTSVKAAWKVLALLTAGYDFVLVIRWFWWRINAWSELGALIASGIGSVIATTLLKELDYGSKFVFVASLSTVTWVAITFLTKPNTLADLERFCRAVRPYPAFWGPVRRAFPDLSWSAELRRSLLLWLTGVCAVFSICFGVGHIMLGTSALGLGLLGFAGVCGIIVLKAWRP
jgi:SSS family transporter